MISVLISASIFEKKGSELQLTGFVLSRRLGDMAEMFATSLFSKLRPRAAGLPRSNAFLNEESETPGRAWR